MTATPTERQLDLLRLIAQGLTNDQIARQQHKEASSASTAVSRLLTRIGAANRAHAVAIAYNRGWLSPPPRPARAVLAAADRRRDQSTLHLPDTEGAPA